MLYVAELNLMTRSHFIEILMILTKYLFDLGVRLTEFSVTVESVTLWFYYIAVFVLVKLFFCRDIMSDQIWNDLTNRLVSGCFGDLTAAYNFWGAELGQPVY